MYRIMICDDEKDEQKKIGGLVDRLMDLLGQPCQIEYASSPEELLRGRACGRKWDLILLDILMNGPSGLTLAQQLHQGGDGTDVVFVTSCAEFALEGYRAYPVSFLVKPLTRDTLLPVLEHCLSHWREAPVFQLEMAERGKVMIPVKEISYIEVFRREIVVHCGDHTETGIGALTEISKQLPGSRFYRCHRSFIVNLEQVVGIKRYQFILRDNGTVPIAVRNYAQAQQRWADFYS